MRYPSFGNSAFEPGSASSISDFRQSSRQESRSAPPRFATRTQTGPWQLGEGP